MLINRQHIFPHRFHSQCMHDACFYTHILSSFILYWTKQNWTHIPEWTAKIKILIHEKAGRGALWSQTQRLDMISRLMLLFTPVKISKTKGKLRILWKIWSHIWIICKTIFTSHLFVTVNIKPNKTSDVWKVNVDIKMFYNLLARLDMHRNCL